MVLENKEFLFCFLLKMMLFEVSGMMFALGAALALAAATTAGDMLWARLSLRHRLGYDPIDSQRYLGYRLVQS